MQEVSNIKVPQQSCFETPTAQCHEPSKHRSSPPQLKDKAGICIHTPKKDDDSPQPFLPFLPNGNELLLLLEQDQKRFNLNPRRCSDSWLEEEKNHLLMGKFCHRKPLLKPTSASTFTPILHPSEIEEIKKDICEDMSSFTE